MMLGRYTVNDVIRGIRVDRGILGPQRHGFGVSAGYIIVSLFGLISLRLS